MVPGESRTTRACRLFLYDREAAKQERLDLRLLARLGLEFYQQCYGKGIHSFNSFRSSALLSQLNAEMHAFYGASVAEAPLKKPKLWMVHKA